MKTFFSFLLVLAVVSTTVSGYAADKDPKSPLGTAVVQSADGFKLFYRSEEAGDVKVAIYNSRNERVFSEMIRNTDNFSRPYNLSTLAPGEYLIELSTPEGKKIHHVNLKRNENRSLMKLTRLAADPDKFILSVPNKGTDVLWVTIYNENDEPVYSHRESVTGDFARVYELKNFGDGFSFQVKSLNGMSEWLTYSTK